MWCVDCCTSDEDKEHSYVIRTASPIVEELPSSESVGVDPFSDEDFTDFFLEDVVCTKTNGQYVFGLVEHKLADVPKEDIGAAMSNTDVLIVGGGDTPPTTSQTSIIGSSSDVDAISDMVKKYTSLECFDLKVPGLRYEQIEHLQRLRGLYLRKLLFYFDEDSFLYQNWRSASHRTNEFVINKLSNLRNKEKVNIVKLTVETDWLRAALEYVKEFKISVTTETSSEDVPAQVGLDLRGVYALDELTGSGPRLVKNIAISAFSRNAFERAESKLDLVLQKNAHKHFSPDKICQTMLRICKAANLSSCEFHHYMRHLRDATMPTCPCGEKGSSPEMWLRHNCGYEAWMLRLE